MALLLSAAAWTVVRNAAEPREREPFAVLQSLVPALRDAEYTRTTRRTNLGSARGQRHTVEVDPLHGPVAAGFLSRPDARPEFAWVVGPEVAFEVDVVEPAPRTLTLFLGSATTDPQDVLVRFNGAEVGGGPLRRDGRTAPLRCEVPADVQKVGRNRVELRFAGTESQQPEGAPRPLPLAAKVLTLRFLPPEEEAAFDPATTAGAGPPVRMAFGREDGHLVTHFVQPEGSLVSAGVELPPGPKVILRFAVVRLGVPLEMTLVPDGGGRHKLLHLDPDRTPEAVQVDLSPWAGQAVRLDLRTPPDTRRRAGFEDVPREVVLAGPSLLVPPDQLPEGWVPADELPEDAPPQDWREPGVFELVSEDPPVLAWTRGDLRLEVDLARRQQRLMDLTAAPKDRKRDVSRGRLGSTALLMRELYLHIREDHPQSHLAPDVLALFRRE